MKFYDIDGSYTELAKDTNFGWSIEELEVYSEIIEESKTIKITEAQTIQECKVNAEDNNSNIDIEMPSKIQLASLITPSSIESKVLLSVVYYALYKTLNNEKINLSDVMNIGKLKFLIKKNKNIEMGILYEIEKYNEDKSTPRSIMVEIVTKEANYDLDFSKDFDVVDAAGDSNSPSSINNHHQQSLTIKNNYKTLGCGRVFDQVDKLYKETHEMYSRISELRKNFQDEEDRVNLLIENAQILQKNLRETRFLDNLIHLLDGTWQQVILKDSPFRILLGSSNNQTDLNLII